MILCWSLGAYAGIPSPKVVGSSGSYAVIVELMNENGLQNFRDSFSHGPNMLVRGRRVRPVVLQPHACRKRRFETTDVSAPIGASLPLLRCFLPQP